MEFGRAPNPIGRFTNSSPSAHLPSVTTRWRGACRPSRCVAAFPQRTITRDRGEVGEKSHGTSAKHSRGSTDWGHPTAGRDAPDALVTTQPRRTTTDDLDGTPRERYEILVRLVILPAAQE